MLILLSAGSQGLPYVRLLAMLSDLVPAECFLFSVRCLLDLHPVDLGRSNLRRGEAHSRCLVKTDRCRAVVGDCQLKVIDGLLFFEGRCEVLRLRDQFGRRQLLHSIRYL